VVANPGDVFGVKFTHLAGKPIVIEFFEGADQAALKTRLQAIFTLVDAEAGKDAAFKKKANDLFAKGLTIVIEDTELYAIKVENGKLFIGTIGFDSMTDASIANGIINRINNGTLAMAHQLDAVRMAAERKAGFERLAAERKAAKILV